MRTTQRSEAVEFVLPIATLLMVSVCAVLSLHAQPSLFVRYPSPDGDIRWVAQVGGTTYRLDAEGIATIPVDRTAADQRLVLWSHFRSRQGTPRPMTITGEGQVSYPVRIYNWDYEDGIEVQAYEHLRLDVQGAHHGAYRASIQRGRVVIEPLDASQPTLILEASGGEVAKTYGLAVDDLLPRSLDPYREPSRTGTKVPDYLQAETVEPVLFSDPRVKFATYIENLGQAQFDREGDILISGYAPFLEQIPITPELVDDSVTSLFGRVTKVNRDRDIMWSVYQGPWGGDAFFDNENSAVSVGRVSRRLPRSAGTYQEQPRGGNDIYIQKWTTDGRLAWTTYLGGTSEEWGGLLAFDDQDNIYVAGWSMSINYPTKDGQILTKPNYPSRGDVVISSLTPDGMSLRWSTYWSSKDYRAEGDTMFGGIGAGVYGLVYDGNGGIVVAVVQAAPIQLPVTPGAWMTEHISAADGLLTRFTIDGGVDWSTIIATTAQDDIYSVVMDTDTTILVRMNANTQHDHYQEATLSTMDAIGVNGETQTPEGHQDFWLRFDLKGNPLLVWAPFSQQSDLSPMGNGKWFTGKPPFGAATPDAFDIRPRWIEEPDTLRTIFSILKSTDYTDFDVLFTSPLFGVAGVDPTRVNGPIRDATRDGWLLLGEQQYPAPGGCLTDTLWGSGDELGTIRSWIALITPNLTTSVAEQAHAPAPCEGGATVYPNPARDKFTLRVSAMESGSVRLYNAQGMLVREQQLHSDTQLVSITDLPSGVYYGTAPGPACTRHFSLTVIR